MKLTKQEVLNLNNGLNTTGDLGGAKFAYAVAKNLTLIRDEISALQEAYKPKAPYSEYESKRLSLAKIHAKKVNDKPQTMIEDGVEKYVMEDKAKFDQELKVLQGLHSEAIDERQKQLDDFAEILKQEIEIDLYTIPTEYIPENITAKQMASILLIIKEESN